jgi:hypothetical protein
MWIDFEQISDAARVWVYPASRSLTRAEVDQINESLPTALGGWAAHGQPLLASAVVVENRFVVIAVDEDQALPSGCSIDASTHFLQAIGQSLGVDFFDRSMAFRDADGLVQTVPALASKKAVADGLITPDTLILNTLVKTKVEFMTDWQQRAGDSWLNRYFRQVVI